MNLKTVLIASNLNVWSIRKGVGAPSFYKTLELYNNKGCKVYFYTTERNCDVHELKNVTVINVPRLRMVNVGRLYVIERFLYYIINQFVFLTCFFGNVKRHKDIDLFYAYELEFVPALRLVSFVLKKPFVSRFQGTILKPLMKKALWRLRYFTHYLSIKIKSDMTIMTDDGTQGDQVIKLLRGNDSDVLFVKNGVDFKAASGKDASGGVAKIMESMTNYKYSFISVSRLEKWKRVDRSIDVFNAFNDEMGGGRYLIVGDGSQKKWLAEYAEEKGIHRHVVFVGGLSSNDVNTLLSASSIFLSHYELSNVGNPLWEAMRNNCLVVTLNNGDTGTIIKDGFNGIISDESRYLDNAAKLVSCIRQNKQDDIIANATETLEHTVVSWSQRMNLEFDAVGRLCNKWREN